VHLQDQPGAPAGLRVGSDRGQGGEREHAEREPLSRSMFVHAVSDARTGMT
jgi:hypothetical protein